jgi:hypothetical protein
MQYKIYPSKPAGEFNWVAVKEPKGAELLKRHFSYSMFYCEKLQVAD